MADDIVPELLEAIQQSFADFVAADADITALLEKVAAGTATHAETEEYALLIGEHAAEALDILTAETLPNGTLYYNIAERTIPPTLQQSYEMVTDVAVQVQQTLNEAAGIGIKPITAELDTERVEGIVNAAVNAGSVEAAQKVISESVVNITQSFADDFVQANAEFHYQAGLKPTITRKVVGGCCDWCMSLAGTYEYGQHPKDIFRRHKNCRCTVTYDPGDGSKQDVWTKKWVTSSEDAAKIEERKTVGLKTSEEIAQEHEQRIALSNSAETGTFHVNDYETSLRSHVEVKRSVVYASATEGGKHHGVFTQAMQYKKQSLQRSIAARTQQVTLHAAKIQNPSAYVAGWDGLSEQYKSGLLRKWEKDMIRNAEQAEIEIAVWKRRF